MNKNWKLLFSFIIIVGVSSVVYIEYKLASPCRELQELQSNPNETAKLKLGLTNFLNSLKVRSELKDMAGENFELAEFSESLKPYISDVKFSSQRLELIIKTNRSDKSFKEPYSILEVGIGFARSYILFTNKNNKLVGKGDSFVQLGEATRLECKT